MAVALEGVLPELTPGTHVCWVVDDAESYLEGAAVLLRDARRTNDKPILFGPADSRPLSELAHLAAVAADPRTAFLDGGPLDPGVMFAVFHEQSALARDEGYERIRVIADMDWLLPAEPAPEEIVAFELMLDRHCYDLNASIVCAYRRESFGVDAITGTRCVHPVDVGGDDSAPFRLHAGADRAWRLAGEIDFAVAAQFSTALATAGGAGPCLLDASDLAFMDVAGMRALAEAGGQSQAIRVVGAPPILRRSWDLAGFAEAAPGVELVGAS